MSAKTYSVVVPAAGVGKRMNANVPKQYLKIHHKTVLEHTLECLISHPQIDHIFLVLHPDDPYFATLNCADQAWLTRVDGGAERADSVLAGLDKAKGKDWILVHDAARPCLEHNDIDKLLRLAETGSEGGILASPVRDTMKRASSDQPFKVATTEDRNGLWHAYTPQFFPCEPLRQSLREALAESAHITDEASAMEWANHQVHLVEGSDRNIKITRPEDLALASFYLTEKDTHL